MPLFCTITVQVTNWGGKEMVTEFVGIKTRTLGWMPASVALKTSVGSAPFLDLESVESMFKTVYK